MTIRREYIDELADTIRELVERRKKIEFELRILVKEYTACISQYLEEQRNKL